MEGALKKMFVSFILEKEMCTTRGGAVCAFESTHHEGVRAPPP